MDGNRKQFDVSNIQLYRNGIRISESMWLSISTNIWVGYTSLVQDPNGYRNSMYACRLSFTTPSDIVLNSCTAVFGSFRKARPTYNWVNVSNNVKLYITSDDSPEYSNTNHSVWSDGSSHNLKPYYDTSEYGEVGTFCCDFNNMQLEPNTTYYLWVNYHSDTDSFVDSLAYIQMESIQWQTVGGFRPSYMEFSSAPAKIFDSGSYATVSEYVMHNGSYQLAIPYVFCDGGWKL